MFVVLNAGVWSGIWFRLCVGFLHSPIGHEEEYVLMVASADAAPRLNSVHEINSFLSFSFLFFWDCREIPLAQC